jgi:hypothetical protein
VNEFNFAKQQWRARAVWAGCAHPDVCSGLKHFIEGMNHPSLTSLRNTKATPTSLETERSAGVRYLHRLGKEHHIELSLFETGLLMGFAKGEGLIRVDSGLCEKGRIFDVQW